VDSLFEPIFQKYCDSISRADFWALLGWLSINLSSSGAIPISFQYGRKDAVTCSVPRTRLPDAQLGRGAINQVFIAQMGLTLTDAVTLIGAHTIGHVHPAASGYGTAATPTTVTTTADLQTNAWDTTPQTFDNRYFRGLISTVLY
jgi:catalase (peroxidase I)